MPAFLTLAIGMPKHAIPRISAPARAPHPQQPSRHPLADSFEPAPIGLLEYKFFALPTPISDERKSGVDGLHDACTADRFIRRVR